MTATQEKWQRHVRAWQTSGVTTKAYAAAHGLQANTLSWWRRRLSASEKRPSVGLVRVGKLVDGQLIVARGRVTVTFAALGAMVACEADADSRCIATVLAALAAQARPS